MKAMKNTSMKLNKEGGKGLTRLQSGLLGMLVNSGMDIPMQNAIMLLLKEDAKGQCELILWIHDNRATSEDIANKWLPKYLTEHKEEIEQMTKPKRTM